MESGGNSVFSSLFWKFGERILAQLISFVVSVVLARLMLPEHYGVVAMVTVFINIANVFVTSGLSTALIQKKEATEDDFSTIFWCTLLISILIYLILFLAAPLISVFYSEPSLVLILRVFAIKIIISALNSVQHSYVSRKMLFRKFFFSTLAGTIISGIVGIVLALKGYGVWALIFQYLTNSVIDTAVLFFTISWRPTFVFNLASAKDLVSFGWKVLAADLIGSIYNNLRQLLIGHSYSASDLAFYNKGKQMPELISNNIDTSISSVLFPAMSNHNDDIEKVKQLTRQSIELTSYIVFPLLFGLMFTAKPLIFVLLTDKWADSIIYLQIICIARALMTVSNANLQAMKAIGRSDTVLRLEFIKKPIGLLMILVAMRYGVVMVALTMPLYSLYSMIVNMSPNKTLLRYGTKEQLLDIMPAFLLSMAMGIVITVINFFINNHYIMLITDILFGVFTYFGLSYVFKVKSFTFLLNKIVLKVKK